MQSSITYKIHFDPSIMSSYTQKQMQTFAATAVRWRRHIWGHKSSVKCCRCCLRWWWWCGYSKLASERWRRGNCFCLWYFYCFLAPPFWLLDRRRFANLFNLIFCFWCCSRLTRTIFLCRTHRRLTQMKQLRHKNVI